MALSHSSPTRNTASARSTTHAGAPHTRVIDPWLLVIVCIGGTVGSAGRYALSTIPATGPGGAFHVGTLAANLIACLFYSGIASFLAASVWINAKHKPYWNRAWCMGVCGGLSTMSALMLETFASWLHANAAWGMVYLLVTFIGVLLMASLGARGGLWIAECVNRRINAKEQQL